MITTYVIGVFATPLLIGLGARIKGVKLNTPPWKMAAASVLWPAALWGVIAATLTDTIANS